MAEYTIENEVTRSLMRFAEIKVLYRIVLTHNKSIQDLLIVYDKRAELWYTICPVVEQVKLFTNYSGGYLILRSGKQQTTTKEKNGVKEAHL